MDFVMQDQAESTAAVEDLDAASEDKTELDQEEGQTQEGTESDAAEGVEEEAPPASEESNRDSGWIRELRTRHRDQQKRIRELEAKLEQQDAGKTPVVPLQKPTLQSCDYDADEFEKRLTAWHDQKRANEAREAETQAKIERQNKDWNDRLAAYENAKVELKDPDFEDAEFVVLEHLSEIQQGIVVKYAKQPAQVVLAIGRDPKKAKELAAIEDPVEFALAVRELDKDATKMTKPKAPPPPEKTISSSGRISGGVDSTLERLRADAEKSGDYTKVNQYKQQQRKAKS